MWPLSSIDGEEGHPEREPERRWDKGKGRGRIGVRDNNRERELLAYQGRSRISYAQEVGVIKINMDCIKPSHALLTSHKP